MFGEIMSLLSGVTVVPLLVAGVPDRIFWNGRRYVVTDTPTPLEEPMYALTHPLDYTGWRFQGTDRDGVSRMFEIALRAGNWELVRVYD
jgi:hypothetical protein